MLTFLMLHLVPGDPVLIFAGDKPLTPERAAELRHQFGLDRPLVGQYRDYASHALRGDLGVGLRSQRPVLRQHPRGAAQHPPADLCALLIAAILGIALGIMAAVAHGRLARHRRMALAMLGISMPVFYSSLLLILFFSFTAGLVPGHRPGRHRAPGAAGDRRWGWPRRRRWRGWCARACWRC